MKNTSAALHFERASDSESSPVEERFDALLGSETSHTLRVGRRWARGRHTMLCLAASLLAASLLAAACAPIMPQRSKLGGAARWAEGLAQRPAVIWADDARLCRVVGVGVGNEGWLPDRGGAWMLTYWSPDRSEVLEVTVDSDGRVTTRTLTESPARGSTLPQDWSDSPRTWNATRPHQQGEPLSTFEVELAVDAERERFPGRPVWRIRFFMHDSSYETHIVSHDGEWLQRY